MSTSIENIELSNFYTSWKQDIEAMQLSDEEGSNSEQIFTQGALDLLAEAGEVENCRLAYDEKALGTPKQHKINAYAISENYETVDLFISIYKGSEEISKTGNDEIEQAGKRISNFFRKAIYSNEKETSKMYKTEYVDEIEESSEIFQFANTLGREKDLRENLIRVNATILTNGLYSGDFPDNMEISGYKIFFKVFDLQALYNVSEKSHIPIEINFFEEGFEVPCIASPSVNSEYQSYLAIIPGIALASIYERFGSRLLEQNVRSFLQIGGKNSTNYKIRETIISEPHMFLAFNNGIAATADDVEFIKNKKGEGLLLSVVKDLQIVNGGQTTASIYHTWKKDKVDISNIFVQVKISVIKNKDNFSKIVSRIAYCANTQNKVNVADFSSNNPYHIEFEKLSRSIYTPISENKNIQTRWFYERARGQYKDAKLKEGFTKSRQKAFELKNPKNQMLTKESLAKYINTFQTDSDVSKSLFGPHIVARGDQKNFIEFSKKKLPTKLDAIYFEDSIAKAILFKEAERIYFEYRYEFNKLRYVTVPYSLAVLTHKSNNQIDLYKIWRNQSISTDLKELLLIIMKEVERYIMSNSAPQQPPEWAKKEDCWLKLKSNNFEFDIDSIKADFIDKKSKLKRPSVNEDDANIQVVKEEEERLRSIHHTIWNKIEEYGQSSRLLSDQQCNIVFTLAARVRTNSKISDHERKNGIKILDIIIDKVPELIFESDEIEDSNNKLKDPEITIELIKKMISWDRQNKRLKPYQFKIMFDLVNGDEKITNYTKKHCLNNYRFISKYGFR